MAKIRQWWSQLLAWITRKKAREVKRSPFREFVYLDDISVISLLVSREGELTDQIQEGRTLEESAGSELGASLGAKDSSVSAKSTFQTKTSQSVQATRKANIQSQFRRLLQQARQAKLLFPEPGKNEIGTEKQLLSDPGSCTDVSSVVRGRLLEFDIQLRVEPLFSMSAIVTEVAAMSEEHPDIFGNESTGLVPGEMKSMAKLLDRFMAGLVPIRSVVTNVRLYESAGKQYLVEAEVAKKLGLTTSEIEVVGVLERERFWKDMRRVLFSDARMTVLGRVGVDGLRESWTPVKLLDLFEDTFPGGADAFAVFENMNFNEDRDTAADGTTNVFRDTLEKYVELVVANGSRELTDEEHQQVEVTVATNQAFAGRPDTERVAFRNVGDQLSQLGFTITPDQNADLREQARTSAVSAVSEAAFEPDEASDCATKPKLIELEVVAMYW